MVTSVTSLVEQLEAQLAALKAPQTTGYAAQAFEVWNCDLRPLLGAALIRAEYGTWSWGFCKSEICNHYSHDPYAEGHTVYVVCRPVGNDEQNHALYQTPDGVVFSYRYARDEGYHYAPTARIKIA